MTRRYNGWRELRSSSRTDRRRQSNAGGIRLVIIAVIMLVLAIAGGILLWKCLRSDDALEVANSEIPLDMTVEPVILSTPEPTAMPTPEPVEEVVEEKIGSIVLDAGHGGVDGGTYYEDVLEKNINFAVVMYMKEILEEEGVEVFLTRSEDDFMDVSERTGIVNQYTEEADLFVSIHCNYFEDDDGVSGLECYYYKEDEVGQASAERMIESLKGNKEIKVRSAKHGGYYVLKFSDMPAVLVEMGFLSNKAERDKLNSEEYQKLLAEELSKAIVLNLKEMAETEKEE